jgi:uncharacterized membrane protein
MTKEERFWEIDSMRGIAIVLMLSIHTVYDLMYFRAIPGMIGGGIWGTLSFLTASTFILLVGVSFSISYARTMEKRKNFWKAYPKYLKRGLFIIAGGLLITISTTILLPGGYIIFGILHLIGTSIILAPFFYRFGENNLYIGTLFFLFGVFLMGLSGPGWLFPLGIHAEDFYSFDYEPIFPWFGMVLVGMSLGTFFYANGKRSFIIFKKPGYMENILGFLGRNSLLIYMLHQPILIGLIYLLH